MSDLTLSYKKVRYDLRPAKQVERLMLIDALRRLASDGFPIANYHYTGMGSVHFYDFSLFHKYAGINRMLSVEASKAIEKRARFNRPYGVITVKMAYMGAVIQSLPHERDHLLWLDYDSTVRQSHLADVTQAIARCRPGSILLVTVDAEPPKDARTSAQVREHFQAEFGDLLPGSTKPIEFARKGLPGINRRLIWAAIERGLNGREGVDFQLLFHFVYEDGHRMLTIGGMIVNRAVHSRLKKSSLFGDLGPCYIRWRRSQRPYVIQVPVVTRKERLYLDAAMPCRDNWRPRQFEMGKREVLAYRDIYRFAPQFAELIL
jgi:hypothetical protein